jgi:hypothetical protein
MVPALAVSIFEPLPFTTSFDLQGWIDTTYMNQDGTFRLARGNKGGRRDFGPIVGRVR